MADNVKEDDVGAARHVPSPESTKPTRQRGMPGLSLRAPHSVSDMADAADPVAGNQPKRRGILRRTAETPDTPGARAEQSGSSPPPPKVPGEQAGTADGDENGEGSIEFHVNRAIELIGAAEKIDAKLTPRDVASVLGYEKLPLPLRSMDALKHALPLMQSRRQRFDSAQDYLRERATWRSEDEQSCAVLSKWFGTLDETERASLELKPVASGGGLPWLQPLMLSVRGATPQKPPSLDVRQLIPASAQDRAALPADQHALLDFNHALALRTRNINIGYLLTLPPELVAALPAQSRAQMGARREAWSAMDVDSSRAAAAFFDDHFSVQAIGDEEKMPIEVAKMIELHPDARAVLSQLSEQGVTLQFVKCTQTPGTVLGEIGRVAAEWNHKFRSNWLPALIKSDETPKKTQADVERIQNAHSRRVARETKKIDADSFRGRALGKLLSADLADNLDLDRSVSAISGFSPMLAITAQGGDEQTLRKLEEINTSLNDTLGREYMLRRLVADDANETSEGAQTIIKSLLWMGPLVDVIQNTLQAGPVAKFIAASSDDITSELGEISALKGAGVTNEEIRKRAVTMAPVAVAALAAASAIDTVSHEAGAHAGGALFMTGAVLLSAATSASSIKYFADQYRQLAKENKLPDHMILSDDAIARLDELSQRQPSREEFLRAVDDALIASGAQPEERDAFIKQIEAMDPQSALRALLGAMAHVNRRDAWRAGLMEAAGINPARLGLAAGTVSAPLMGFLLGGLFVHNPLLYTLAGSWETMVGAASIAGFNRTFDARWARFVKAQTELAPGRPRDCKA